MLQPEDKDLDESGAAGDFCTCGFCKLVWDQTARGEKKQLKKQTMLENKSRGEGYERVVAVVVMILLHLSAPHTGTLAHTHQHNYL